MMSLLRVTGEAAVQFSSFLEKVDGAGTESGKKHLVFSIYFDRLHVVSMMHLLVVQLLYLKSRGSFYV